MECTGYTTRRPEKARRNITFGTRLWRLWNDEIGFVHRLSNAESSASTAMAWVVVVAECFGSLPDDWAEAAARSAAAVLCRCDGSGGTWQRPPFQWCLWRLWLWIRTPARLFLSWVPERLVLGWLGASFKGFFIRLLASLLASLCRLRERRSQGAKTTQFPIRLRCCWFSYDHHTKYAIRQDNKVHRLQQSQWWWWRSARTENAAPRSLAPLFLSSHIWNPTDITWNRFSCIIYSYTDTVRGSLG